MKVLVVFTRSTVTFTPSPCLRPFYDAKVALAGHGS